jgi:hypothetical protein
MKTRNSDEFFSWLLSFLVTYCPDEMAEWERDVRATLQRKKKRQPLTSREA